MRRWQELALTLEHRWGRWNRSPFIGESPRMSACRVSRRLRHTQTGSTPGSCKS
jgi:hypothetical protein